jgi:hypothetical protein
MSAQRLWKLVRDFVIVTRPIGWFFETLVILITLLTSQHFFTGLIQGLLWGFFLLWLYRGVADILIQQKESVQSRKTRATDENVFDYYGG